MTWIPYLFLFILGSAWGSFLNAWEWRMRTGRSVAKGRSMCPHCKTQLRWRDNIPLVSYFLLKGKCYQCKKHISLQYPLVEAVLGIFFVVAGAIHSVPFVENYSLLARDLFILFALGFIFIYDFKYQEIPDEVSLPSVVLLFVGGLFFQWHSWQSMLIGAAAGAGFFLLQYVVSKGRWIGGGDIRLGLLMGVILGWPLVLFALLLAYVIGMFVSLPFLIAKKKSMASKVPFGTYLAVATIIALWWGNDIIQWYVWLLAW